MTLIVMALPRARARGKKIFVRGWRIGQSGLRRSWTLALSLSCRPLPPPYMHGRASGLLPVPAGLLRQQCKQVQERKPYGMATRYMCSRISYTQST